MERNNRFGEPHAIPILAPRHAASDEGSYFTATAAAPGTAQALGIMAAFSATAPVCAVKNNDAAAARARTIQLDYWRAIVSVVPASATLARWAVITDSGDRTPSAGHTLLTPNPTYSSPNAAPSKSQVWVPNAAFLTVPAAVAARTIATGNFGGIPVVGDELVIQFGGERQASTTAATAGTKVGHCPPVTLEAGHFALVYIWFPNNAVTGASLEPDVGFIER